MRCILPSDLIRQIVNIGLKSGKCVSIDFGIGSLGTLQVMILEATVLGFEFLYNRVPFRSCRVAVYKVVELEGFQLKNEYVTLNETSGNDGDDAIW